MPKSPAERRRDSDTRRRTKFENSGKKQISAWVSPAAVAELDRLSKKLGLNRSMALDAILRSLAGHEKFPAPKPGKSKKAEPTELKDLFSD